MKWKQHCYFQVEALKAWYDSPPSPPSASVVPEATVEKIPDSPADHSEHVHLAGPRLVMLDK